MKLLLSLLACVLVFGACASGTMDLDCNTDTGHIFYNGQCFTAEEFEEEFPDVELDGDGNPIAPDGEISDQTPEPKGEESDPEDGSVVNEDAPMCTPGDVSEEGKECSEKYKELRKQLAQYLPQGLEVLVFMAHDKEHPAMDVINQSGGGAYVALPEQITSSLGYQTDRMHLALGVDVAQNDQHFGLVAVVEQPLTDAQFNELKEKLSVGKTVDLGMATPITVVNVDEVNGIHIITFKDESGVQDARLAFSRNMIALLEDSALDLYRDVWKGGSKSLYEGPRGEEIAINCDYYLHGYVKLKAIVGQFVDQDDLGKWADKLVTLADSNGDVTEAKEFVSMFQAHSDDNKGMLEFGLKIMKTQDPKIYGTKLIQIHLALYNGEKRASRLSFEFTDQAVKFFMLMMLSDDLPYWGEFKAQYDQCQSDPQQEPMCAVDSVNINAGNDDMQLSARANDESVLHSGTFKILENDTSTATTLKYEMNVKNANGDYVPTFTDGVEQLIQVQADGKLVMVLNKPNGDSLCKISCKEKQ